MIHNITIVFYEKNRNDKRTVENKHSKTKQNKKKADRKILEISI